MVVLGCLLLEPRCEFVHMLRDSQREREREREREKVFTGRVSREEGIHSTLLA